MERVIHILRGPLGPHVSLHAREKDNDFASRKTKQNASTDNVWRKRQRIVYWRIVKVSFKLLKHDQALSSPQK